MRPIIIDLAKQSPKPIGTRNHSGQTPVERKCCVHPDRKGNFPVFGLKGHNYYCLNCAMKAAERN